MKNPFGAGTDDGKAFVRAREYLTGEVSAKRLKEDVAASFLKVFVAVRSDPSIVPRLEGMGIDCKWITEV